MTLALIGSFPSFPSPTSSNKLQSRLVPMIMVVSCCDLASQITRYIGGDFATWRYVHKPKRASVYDGSPIPSSCNKIRHTHSPSHNSFSLDSRMKFIILFALTGVASATLVGDLIVQLNAVKWEFTHLNADIAALCNPPPSTLQQALVSMLDLSSLVTG